MIPLDTLIRSAPPGVIVGNPTSPPPAGSWMAELLSIATALGLPTTAWETGQPLRTMLEICSVAQAKQDVLVSMAIQGGFLDYAATGTVVEYDLEGNATQVQVSVDPSTVTPTPTVANTWLDALASSFYDVQRVPATYARVSITGLNDSIVTYGPFAPGTYHVSNPSTGATYSNVSTLSIPPGAIAPFIVVADLIGPVGSAAANAVTGSVTVLPGVAIGNLASAVGSNWQTNISLANLCRLKLGSLSPDGADAAYAFFALSALQKLAAQTPTVTLRGGSITRVLVQSDRATGHVVVTAANAAGVVSGCVQLAVVGAVTSAGLVEIQTTSAHGLSTGDFATVSGVVGVPGANITSTVTVVDGTHFTQDGSVFSGAYVSGGTVEGGDLGELDALLQANVVPNAVTEITQSASNVTINMAFDIYLPAASIAAALVAIPAALLTYLAALPIGGASDPGGAFTNVVPYNEVLGVVIGAIRPLGGLNATGTLNGGTTNVAIGATQVATQGTLAITGHGT